MKKALSLVLGCIIWLNLTYAAALPENVECLIKDNKHTEAIAILEPLAKKGEGEAQNKLGEVYHFSPKPVQDYRKARHWYLKAVRNGSGVAANHLGRLYTNGEGVKKDRMKAQRWYKKGMDLGDAAAEVNYYFGQGNGFYFILLKALYGDDEAREAAARFYEKGGLGVPKDPKKALLYRQRIK